MDEILKYFPGMDDRQRGRFAALGGLYADWNAKINVISRKDMDNFYTHHVLHSLSIAAAMDNVLGAGGQRILDLGTGGGFPGIPLAIRYPQNQFVLCDSIGKKIKVATAVAQSLELDNIQTVNARAESLDGGFDWVVSRAVAPLDKILSWVRGKWSKGVVCLKGGDVEEEIATCISRRMLDPKKVLVSDISIFFKDEWFQGKKVVAVAQ